MSSYFIHIHTEGQQSNIIFLHYDPRDRFDERKKNSAESNHLEKYSVFIFVLYTIANVCLSNIAKYWFSNIAKYWFSNIAKYWFSNIAKYFSLIEPSTGFLI